ncbi:MAG TPA: hypothetical protein VMU82_12455 [Acetobacteraceae bacterium]|nr:hypothetical protein [Acetobacteraceae bacterium]
MNLIALALLPILFPVVAFILPALPPLSHGRFQAERPPRMPD